MTTRSTPAFRRRRKALGVSGRNLVGEQHGARHHAIDGHEDAGRPFVAHPLQEPPAPGRWWNPFRDIGEAADGDPLAVHQALQARAGTLVHLRGNGQRQFPIPRCRDDRLGDHVLGRLVEGCGQTQQFRGANRLARFHGDEASVAAGEGPCLVEQQYLGLGQHLQGGGAFDQDATLGAAGYAGDDRDRNGQDQRTWCGYDQYRQRSGQVPGNHVRNRRDDQRQRYKEQSVAIREPG